MKRKRQRDDEPASDDEFVDKMGCNLTQLRHDDLWQRLPLTVKESS